MLLRRHDLVTRTRRPMKRIAVVLAVADQVTLAGEFGHEAAGRRRVARIHRFNPPRRRQRAVAPDHVELVAPREVLAGAPYRASGSLLCGPMGNGLLSMR